MENDLDGYSEKELSVYNKYPSYKEEILSHVDIETYDAVMIKANNYSNTEKLRAMKINVMGFNVFKYGISKADAVKLEHIISLILYTDYSAYCTEFSSTFRKIYSAESFESVKHRNARFWWQSKLFREMVECYGIIADDWGMKDGRKGETGPFYSGLGAVLAVPEFAIRLCSPTSTSKQVAVSLSFATRAGMILQLNNDTKDASRGVPFFNVSWISRFPDEDERVFAGLITVCSNQSIYSLIKYIY